MSFPLKATFNFSQFLSAAEQCALARPEQWEWITPVDGSREAHAARTPAALAQKHRKWTTVKGNTHRPPHREVMLTLRGEAVYSINGEAYLRHPGTVILLDHHEARDLKGSAHKTGFTCLWLHLLNREHLTYYINSCDEKGRYTQPLPMRSRTGDAPRLMTEAWDHCLARNDEILGQTLLRSAIAATLLEILGNVEPVSRESHQEQVIHSIKEYIRHHLAENLSLHNLANIAGYSPFFFHRQFLRHTGQTPLQYVNAARLAKANELLARNYTVEATAAEIGFSSVSYFHQFYKKHLHRTPGRGASS